MATVPLFWNSQPRPKWVRYGVALILVGIGAICNFLMPPIYDESHYFFFSVAILASALFGGLGPGLLATTVSALASAYLFIAPFNSFQIEAPEAAERLAMFMVEGAIISLVGHVIRDNRTPKLFSTWGRYGSAVVLVAGAAIWKALFFPAVEQHLPFTFFYSAVVITAWVAGAVPGLWATVLATGCVHHWFLYSVATPGKLGLALFALEASGLCLLTAMFRQRLVETEAHLGRVFDDCPTGILVLEGGARILRANPASQQILRADRGCLEGCCFSNFVHPDSRERVHTFLDHLTQQPAISAVEEVCLIHDTTTAWANLRGSWMRGSDPDARVLMVMIEDITERRRNEEALQQAEARLERGQRVEAVGMFAGGIAHDFNNLLAIIFTCCEQQLLQKDLPPQTRAYTEEIMHTARTAADLTCQLLTFARRRPRGDQVISVNQLVEESAALLRRLLGARIELKTELGPDAGQVRADPVQLQQILMNLAANARDAMPSGGRLTIQTSQTKIAASGAGVVPKEYVTLRVADTGRGMDETTRARIFEPFFSTKDLEKGTGLGLATVHSIVTKLGGYIGVESSPGNGACFSIHLPIQMPT